MSDHVVKVEDVERIFVGWLDDLVRHHGDRQVATVLSSPAIQALFEGEVGQTLLDPRTFDHCGCGGGCCQTLSFLESTLCALHRDGPERIGDDEYQLVCSLLDDMGK